MMFVCSFDNKIYHKMKSEEPDTIHERISKLIDHFSKGNKTAFGRETDILPGVLASITGGRMSKPSFELLQKILIRFPEINGDWLIIGRGSMLKLTSGQTTWQDPFTSSPQQGEQRSFLPPDYLREMHRRQEHAIEEGKKRMDYFEKQLESLIDGLPGDEAKRMRESKPVFINPEHPILEQFEEHDHDE